jgi:hypothetical protein
MLRSHRQWRPERGGAIATHNGTTATRSGAVRARRAPLRHALRLWEARWRADRLWHTAPNVDAQLVYRWLRVRLSAFARWRRRAGRVSALTELARLFAHHRVLLHLARRLMRWRGALLVHRRTNINTDAARVHYANCSCCRAFGVLLAAAARSLALLRAVRLGAARRPHAAAAGAVAVWAKAAAEAKKVEKARLAAEAKAEMESQLAAKGTRAKVAAVAQAAARAKAAREAAEEQWLKEAAAVLIGAPAPWLGEAVLRDVAPMVRGASVSPQQRRRSPRESPPLSPQRAARSPRCSWADGWPHTSPLDTSPSRASSSLSTHPTTHATPAASSEPEPETETETETETDSEPPGSSIGVGRAVLELCSITARSERDHSFIIAGRAALLEPVTGPESITCQRPAARPPPATHVALATHVTDVTHAIHATSASLTADADADAAASAEPAELPSYCRLTPPLASSSRFLPALPLVLPLVSPLASPASPSPELASAVAAATAWAELTSRTHAEWNVAAAATAAGGRAKLARRALRRWRFFAHAALLQAPPAPLAAPWSVDPSCPPDRPPFPLRPLVHPSPLPPFHSAARLPPRRRTPRTWPQQAAARCACRQGCRAGATMPPPPPPPSRHGASARSPRWRRR